MDRTANHLASYGRHGDDTLLHVSRAELQGIRQLTGKGFTINPHTGLPEAFNWAKAILPAIAAVGITALTAGLGAPAAAAAAAGALGSGAASFGIGKAQGESTNQALMGGLISGATSFAGGQLLSGVGDVAGEAAGTAASLDPTNASGGFAGAEAAHGITAINPTTPALDVTNAGFQGAEAAAGNTAPALNGSQVSAPAAATTNATPSVANSFSNLGNRISNAASDPGTTLSQIGTNIQKNPISALATGAGLYASGASPTGQPRIQREAPYDPAAHPPKYPDRQPTWTPDPAGYVPGVSPERRYDFAKGGLASLRQEEGMTANVVNEAKAALLNEHPRPKEALARFERMFGADALGMLRDKMTGGQIRGAGGGLDDLVPGTIEGRQKVRLADSEFVLPSDIVSAIGDGSTDHGVRRLHEMMDNIRKQKTGGTKQPPRLKKGTLVDGS
jgi:hypothetical protein